jgi:hypothetical protein
MKKLLVVVALFACATAPVIQSSTTTASYMGATFTLQINNQTACLGSSGLVTIPGTNIQCNTACATWQQQGVSATIDCGPTGGPQFPIVVTLKAPAATAKAMVLQAK